MDPEDNQDNKGPDDLELMSGRSGSSRGSTGPRSDHPYSSSLDDLSSDLYPRQPMPGWKKALMGVGIAAGIALFTFGGIKGCQGIKGLNANREANQKVSTTKSQYCSNLNSDQNSLRDDISEFNAIKNHSVNCNSNPAACITAYDDIQTSINNLQARWDEHNTDLSTYCGPDKLDTTKELINQGERVLRFDLDMITDLRAELSVMEENLNDNEASTALTEEYRTARDSTIALFGACVSGYIPGDSVRAENFYGICKDAHSENPSSLTRTCASEIARSVYGSSDFNVGINAMKSDFAFMRHYVNLFEAAGDQKAMQYANSLKSMQNNIASYCSAAHQPEPEMPVDEIPAVDNPLTNPDNSSTNPRYNNPAPSQPTANINCSTLTAQLQGQGMAIDEIKAKVANCKNGN